MTNNKNQIVLGGGCFWCLEAIYSRIDGCDSVTPGYTAGVTNTPTYQQVCTGNTGHVEAVQIVYDASKVKLSALLEVFFATHDPTTLNRQGNDVGTQYRSIVCYSNDKEKEIIKEAIAQQQSSLNAPIVTQVEELTEFYPAEIEHHDYYQQNANQPYCQIVIKPKLDKLISWKESQ